MESKSHTCIVYVDHKVAFTAYITALSAADCGILELIEHGFTSAPAPTQYRLYGRRFLQVWWPNQQCQSTEGG